MIKDGLMKRLTNDLVKIEKNDQSLKASAFSISGTCRNNNLCKQYNCDQVQTYKWEKVRKTRDFGGFSWIVVPNDGFKCFNTWFNGCNAEKWVDEKKYYYKDRNTICGQKVTTTFTPS